MIEINKSNYGDTLDKSQITKLNSEENLDLDESKLYILRFLWNNELNQATDPFPFQIPKSLNQHLESDAIGMPYIVGPDPHQHLKGKENTAQSLLELQADYAIGNIEKIITSDAGNRYGVISIYPDYEDDVLQNKIPPLVSPTFATEFNEKKEIVKADFLNLNAIDSGGYPTFLTKIVGACKNGIKQCVSELAVLAAAGPNELKNARKEKSFTNTLLKKTNTMSEQENPAPSLEMVVKDLDATKQQVVTLTETVDTIQTTVETIAEKVGVEKKEKPEEEVEGEGEVIETPPVAGAAGRNTQTVQIKKHPDFLKMEKELDELKKLSDKREKQIQAEHEKIRVTHATQIVEIMTKNKKLTEDEKAAQIKNWVDKVDADGNPENLELVSSTLESIPIPQIAGAAGPYGVVIPDMQGDGNTTQRTNREMLSKMGVLK